MKNRIRNKFKHKMKRRVGLLLVVAAFLLLAEYMPKVAAFVFEKQNINRYQMIKRDDVEDGIRYSLSRAEKMRVLCSEDIRMSEIFVIRDVGELSSQAPDLLDNAKLGVDLWKRKGILPMENALKMEEDTFERATYYTVCNGQNSNLTVNIWLLHFVMDEGEIHLYMDAESNEIYALSIPNTGVGDYVNTFKMNMRQESNRWEEQEEETKTAYTDKSEKDQLLEYWANAFADELRMYYSAYYVSSSYVLPELCIVDFKIYFETDTGEEIAIPYYVTFNTDVENAYENGRNIYIGLLGLIELLEQE